ncbi:MAG: aspartate aminotransferase [Bacteroidetes bacterium]|nr:MAG: aspartate aminotransferase [Bacteroidota bacterium]
MPDISDRGKSMPESPIRKLVPYAEAAKARGLEVYHLNIGQPDIESPKIALDKIRNLSDKVIEYSHSAGNESYRRGLADYYHSVGIEVSYEQILVTTAGSEAIIFGLMSCLNPGDEVIIPEPFYTNYNGFATMSGVKVTPITAQIDDGFSLPNIDEFEKAINVRTKAIMLCNPNNPTGYLYSQDELESLRELVIKHDLYLFADEVYREFCYDGKEHFSAMNLKDLDEHVVLIDSVSKRYSMCGARVGTIVSRNKKLMSTVLKYAQARLSPPSFGQIAAEAALATPASYFSEVREEYLIRRDLVVETLNKMEGVFCPNPSGAFYVIARLPIDDCDKFCQWLLEDFSHEGKTVMMAPASGFYATEGLGKNEVRIAYVLNTDSLRLAMEALEVALKEYPGRTN